MSLRARLLITTVVLVAVGLVAANVATYRYLSTFLLQRVDEQLERGQFPVASALSVRGGFDPHHGSPDFGAPLGTFGELRDGSGTQAASFVFGFPDRSPPRLDLPSGLPGSDAPSGAEDSRFLTVKATGGVSPEYRVIATALGGGQGTLIVAIPLGDVSATLRQLLVVEGVVSAIVLLAVAGLALWLVRLGLRPLEGIGETAGAIAAGDLTRRVEPATGRTEVGRLGVALNSMLAQIESAFEERRASESRLRRFVADASHELRTPLTSIRGYAELFRRGADSRPDDLAKTMRRIEDEASRMGVLVDEMLLLARLDQGRPLDREEVDIARLAADAVESARTIEPDRPVSLDVEGPAVIVGDRSRLRQVIDNLLDNVRVHTAAGTAVHVTVKADPEEVLVFVADEGLGLSSEVADRVFERFYRGDPARARGTGGSGLGLSIVAAIVQAHGGTTTVSNGDGGATFEVRLPIRRTDEPPEEPEADASPSADPHPERQDDPGA